MHKWLKGDQQPDVMYSTLFAGITTDPSTDPEGEDGRVDKDLEV